MSSQPPAKKGGELPDKSKSKEQSNEVALAAPVTVVIPMADLPGFTPHLTLALRIAGGSDSSMAGEDLTDISPVTNGPLPQIESIAAGNGPGSEGTASGSDSTEAEPMLGTFVSDVAGPTRSQGETAFEARIQVPTPDVADKVTGGPTDNPVSTDQAASTSQNAPAPLTAPALSFLKGAQETVDHKVARNAEPARSVQDHGAPLPQPKVSATDGTSQNFSGSEQKDTANPKKESGATERTPLDSPLCVADPQTPGSTISTAIPIGSSGSASATKSEPQVAPVNYDPASDVGSAPRASAPTRDIALQLQDAGGSRVDVQVVDRGGTVHVVVRTQDDGLAKDLRTNLPDLAQRLNQQGMEADTWSPVEMHNTAGGHENPGHSHEQTPGDSNSSADGHDSGGRDGDQRQRSRPDPEDEFNQSFKGFFTGVTA